MPVAEKVAGVASWFGYANVTVPGPLSMDHVIVKVPFGSPSSLTVPVEVSAL